MDDTQLENKGDEKVSLEFSKTTLWQIISGVLGILLVISIFTNGFGFGSTSNDGGTAAVVKDQPLEDQASGPEISGKEGSFNIVKNAEICKKDGKPIIRLFSTTWCPHCQWIKDTFAKVTKEYVDKGQIVAYNWEMDVGNDALTKEIETIIPDGEAKIFKEFNPQGSIPTFVFGCKYFRSGNPYETEGDQGLIKDEAEFILGLDL